MNEIPYKKEIDPKAKALVMIFVLLVVGVVIGLIISSISLNIIESRAGSTQGSRVYWSAFSNNFTLQTIFITMNLSILAGLLYFYFKSYKETKSGFLLGLVLFLGVLFVQSLLSMPLLDLLTTVSGTNAQIGFTSFFISYQSIIFKLLANMFETIALIILYYLSME